MSDSPDNPHSSSPGHSGFKQFVGAAIGFLLPLAIFFGWFFLFRGLPFGLVLAALLSLIVLSLVSGARFKHSRALKVGSTWLFVGCLGALFWALLINGTP